MSSKKKTIIEKIKGVFVGFLVLVSLLSGVVTPLLRSESVYAEPTTDTSIVDEPTNDVVDNATTTDTDDDNGVKADTCKVSLGALGWAVCPMVNKISEAVDWLYERIEGILAINPIKAKDGEPIYEIWKYCLGVTNIVFIIFLLVVIYSQITGWGINNYGIKKALPKLIVMGILVNLSFLICVLAVDVSNIIGNGLRNVFQSVELAAVGNSTADASSMTVSMAETYTAMAGGSALAIGAGMVAFDLGMIWMLIPVALGAIVSVVIGLVTIAMRQAVVVLLVMIAPLAFVANILPNTEQWFQKWKKLLTQMLVFYPMFSLLFGASSLAGFALIMSAKDGFMLMLGIAVQIFPLFFSWKMMQMSGTVLGDINSRLRALADKPLAASRAKADAMRQLKRQKTLAAPRVYTPSAKLMQFMSNRRIAREEEMNELAETTKMRGQAYAARRNYRKNGLPSREGEEAYARQARNLYYSGVIERHKNNMNKGLGQLEVVKATASKAQKVRLEQLDLANVKAADNLKMEKARGAKIDYDNTVSYYDRVKKAAYANADAEALKAGDSSHQMHDGVLADKNNLARYKKMTEVMEGAPLETGYIVADAAHTFGAQSQIVKSKFSSLFNYTEATQDIVKEMDRLTKNVKAADYIDPIVAGLRTLNMRGDTNLVKDQINQVLAQRNTGIGSHALQEIASFCMFDVKDNDPALRRFGKYINMQTAKMFNEAPPEERRTRKDISYYEYINGEYIDRDAEGHVIYNTDGTPRIQSTKSKSAAALMKGTSFRDMERTAITSMEEMIRDNSVDLSIDEHGNEVRKFNYEKFKQNEKSIWNAIMPNVIGDHFSFRSGSEQITAMSKGITGIDIKKHNVDWEGIFGKDVAATLTPAQKKDYINFLNERTKIFLGGQVPSQIARTKSDMLTAIRNQYTLKEAMDNDEGFFENELSRPDYKMDDARYAELERSHLDGVKKQFVGSFKEDALKGFVKMHYKGYQGEAKDGLIKLLDPDALYVKYFPNGENNRGQKRGKDSVNDKDDDDGAPVDFGNGVNGEPNGAIYNDARSSIDTVFDAYRGTRRLDVEGFWNEVKDVLRESDRVQQADIIIENIENKLSQYTDAAVLYTDIMNTLFGGFDE